MSSERRQAQLVVWSTLFFVAAFVAMYLVGQVAPGSAWLDLGREDGPVEYLGALFWGGTSLLCLLRLLRGQTDQRLLLLFWGLFAFVCMGEEVSWFQRVAGFDTPEPIRELNTQQEFNLHNLAPVYFGRYMNSQQAFNAGFLSWFLVLPLLTGVRRVQSWVGRLGYASPRPSFLVMVWTVIGVSYLVQLLGSSEAERVIAESRESFFAFAVLAYVAVYLRGAAAVHPLR